ncbi:MAG: pseudouridine synthase [Cellulosilyticum sp.]|nr:pseudouridine synthase [Cellulosilyticum sp.]
MRINKLLSNKGICSRKQTNIWIEAGRIQVNGKLAICGQWVEEEDEILLDGKPLEAREKVYLLLNKPIGVTCTADQNVKDNIIDYMDYPEYIFPVGRLDKDSQGLIFMTNDGDLAHQILNAEYEHEKEYLVTVHQPFDEAFLANMERGVTLGEVTTRPCKLMRVSEDTFKIILTQGLNRQIRKMCLAFGYKVIRLERIRILFLEKEDLPYGKWRFLSDDEVKKLNKVTAH